MTISDYLYNLFWGESSSKNSQSNNNQKKDLKKELEEGAKVLREKLDKQKLDFDNKFESVHSKVNNSFEQRELERQQKEDIKEIQKVQLEKFMNDHNDLFVLKPKEFLAICKDGKTHPELESALNDLSSLPEITGICFPTKFTMSGGVATNSCSIGFRNEDNDMFYSKIVESNSKKGNKIGNYDSSKGFAHVQTEFNKYKDSLDSLDDHNLVILGCIDYMNNL